jgi:hypothetical protein
MRKRLEIALDACLDALQQGQSLDECLARFEHLRAELEPLLSTALVLRRVSPSPATPVRTLSRGRARFMAEVQCAQASRRAPRRSLSFMWQPRPLLVRGLATVSLAFVLLIGMLSGGRLVSASSLPGDPLYAVKRASENVQLILTLSAEERAELQRRLAELRVSEVKQVTELGREVDVRFEGTVEKVEDGTIVVHGISVRLVSDASDAFRPTVGSAVQVEARTTSDGAVQAKSLAVSSAPVGVLPQSEPLPTETLSAHVRPTALPTLEPTQKPTTIEQPSPAPLPSSTAQPDSTATPDLTATPIQSVTPSATAIATPSNTPLPTATATLVPPPRLVEVRIEGRISEITSQYWTINGRRVMIQAGTSVNQSRAQAQIDGWATVIANQQEDGTLLAREIVVWRGPDVPPEPKEFQGVIEAIQDGWWTIAARSVIVNGDTVIEGEPRVGLSAVVKAEQHADGRLVARHIVIESPVEKVVQLAGIINAIEGDRWVIAGQVVLITAETQIEGSPRVGVIAEVEAVVTADGTLRARRVRVHAPPAEQATTVPEATLTPEPTQTILPPTATAAPSATPTVAPSSTPSPNPAVTEQAPVEETSTPVLRMTPANTPTPEAEPTPAAAPATQAMPAPEAPAAPGNALSLTMSVFDHSLAETLR